MAELRRVRAKEWLFLAFMLGGCSCRGCCDFDFSGSEDEDDAQTDEEASGCGFGPVDDCVDCDPQPEPEPDPQPQPQPQPQPPMDDPMWRDCDHVPGAQRFEGALILVSVQETIAELGRAAAARERLAWAATAGLRRRMMIPTAPDGADTDTDTDADASTGGATSTGDGTTGGAEPEPPAIDGWTFEAGVYAMLEGELAVQSSWTAIEQLPFAAPGDVLSEDLRVPQTYLADFAFVPTQPDPPLLPSAGELTFAAPGPYHALLGLPEATTSAFPVLREDFVHPFPVDLSLAGAGDITDAVSLQFERVGEDGDLVVFDADAEPRTLLDLFVGVDQAWSVAALEVHAPATDQTAELQAWSLDYDGAGGVGSLYPDDPSFEASGRLVGEVEVRVTGFTFDYDAVLRYGSDSADAPEITVTCD